MRKGILMMRLAWLTSPGILLLALGLGDPRPVRGDSTVTAVGSVSCFDGTRGTTAPLAGAKVVMMDSDADGSTLFDDEMGHDGFSQMDLSESPGRAATRVPAPMSTSALFITTAME